MTLKGLCRASGRVEDDQPRGASRQDFDFGAFGVRFADRGRIIRRVARQPDDDRLRRIVFFPAIFARVHGIRAFDVLIRSDTLAVICGLILFLLDESEVSKNQGFRLCAQCLI